MFWYQSQILYANESHEIRNHKKKTSGTSREHFGSPSHDDIQKFVNKLKNKNMIKVTVLPMPQSNPQKMTKFYFLQNWKKQDGLDYKSNSLCSMQALIDRCLWMLLSTFNS